MLHIAICDDNILIVEHLRKQIQSILKEENIIYEYTNPHQFEEKYIKEIGDVLDILIIDIVFFDTTGIDIVKRIQSKNGHVKIIYISGYAEYAEKIFETNPKYFLIKPITKKKLEKAINKSLEDLKENKEKNELFLGNENKMVRLVLQDILYFESNKRIINIHNVEDRTSIYMKLGDLEEKLPYYFVRCHQSYIVNLKNVEKMQNNSFLLKNRRNN